MNQILLITGYNYQGSSSGAKFGSYSQSVVQSMNGTWIRELRWQTLLTASVSGSYISSKDASTSGSSSRSKSSFRMTFKEASKSGSRESW